MEVGEEGNTFKDDAERAFTNFLSYAVMYADDVVRSGWVRCHERSGESSLALAGEAERIQACAVNKENHVRAFFRSKPNYSNLFMSPSATSPPCPPSISEHASPACAPTQSSPSDTS